MSHMSDTLSIRIEPGLRRELQKTARRQHRKASDVARDALRQYLAGEELRRLREQLRPYAEAQGFLTDEDVFKSVS